MLGHLERDWVPVQGVLTIEMHSLPEGGAIIFSRGDRLPSGPIRTFESETR